MANQLVFNKESKINNGEKIVSSGSGVRGTEQPHVNQLEHSNIIYKNKWTKGLNIRYDIIKLLEEKWKSKLQWDNISQWSEQPSPNVYK